MTYKDLLELLALHVWGRRSLEDNVVLILAAVAQLLHVQGYSQCWSQRANLYAFVKRPQAEDKLDTRNRRERTYMPSPQMTRNCWLWSFEIARRPSCRRQLFSPRWMVHPRALSSTNQRLWIMVCWPRCAPELPGHEHNA